MSADRSLTHHDRLVRPATQSPTWTMRPTVSEALAGRVIRALASTSGKPQTPAMMAASMGHALLASIIPHSPGAARLTVFPPICATS